MRIEALSSAINTVLSTPQVGAYSAPRAIPKSLYSNFKSATFDSKNAARKFYGPFSRPGRMSLDLRDRMNDLSDEELPFY
jgi:hypothetical protein